MSIRTMLLRSAVILAAAGAPGLALADIIVQTSPPPVETETPPPAPHSGYIWAPGYQKWEGDHYEWTPGHWVEARVHSHWVPDNWEQVDENHWRFRAGHWATD